MGTYHMTTNEWRDTAATTLARIEAKQDSMEDKIDVLSVTLLGNGKPEEGLLFRVSEHHKAFHIGKVCRSPKTWLAAIAFFIAAHWVVELFGNPLLNWILGALKLPPINLG